MAGRGPAPKASDQRARRNKDVLQLRVLPATATTQPSLPTIYFDVEIERPGEAKETVKRRFNWPTATRGWWSMLAHHPLAPEFTDLDWSYLAETALIHAHFWKGDMRVASELRLREAKYGFTPEDRARLRLQFAIANTAEIEAKERLKAHHDQAPGSSRDRARGIARRDTA
ncbi:phage terminase small subunit [Microbacterium allomyrinae]|uniref:Uncharacterized protein n=1 Tax=Microbacterium allomyrinae TaxID=2830666 RepID=A0A9X1LUL4_9MICO|nr:hypothetical protein [Microbacterium allomyrinae]MCC2031820.1 hypothetical protein [Microbacterium allomyrinae]